MSEEIAIADANLNEIAELRTALDYANGRVRYEQARREQAEADAGALRAEIQERAMKDAEDTHRLQAYCAALHAELTAARAVVEAAWTHDWGAVAVALRAYDEVTKEGS